MARKKNSGSGEASSSSSTPSYRTPIILPLPGYVAPTMERKFADYFGPNGVVLGINHVHIAEALKGSITTTLSKTMLTAGNVVVHGYANLAAAKAATLADFIEKGNGIYTFGIIQDVADNVPIRVLPDPDPWGDNAPTLIDANVAISLDFFLRFAQGHSIMHLNTENDGSIKLTDGKIPNYIRQYLNLPITKSKTFYVKLLGGDWIEKFPSDFIKEFDYGTFPSDLKARIMLSPAGMRMISVFNYLNEGDLNEGASNESKAFLAVMKKVANDGFRWEIHPSFRPGQFHSAIGNLNAKVATFLAEAVKMDVLNKLKDQKVIYAVPAADVRRGNWKSLNADSFNFMATKPRGF